MTGTTSRGRYIAIAAVIAASVIAIAVTAFLTSGKKATSTPSTKTGSTESTSNAAPLPHLDQILLEPEAQSALLGTPMTMSHSDEYLFATSIKHTVSPAECNSTLNASMASTYADLDWLTAWSKNSANASNTQVVNQSVVLAADPDAAKTFWNNTYAAWKGCKGRTLNTGEPADGTWLVDDVSLADPDIIVAALKPTTGQTWWCQHTLAIKGAYLVESQMCAEDVGKGRGLVDKVLSNIPA